MFVAVGKISNSLIRRALLLLSIPLVGLLFIIGASAYCAIKIATSIIDSIINGWNEAVDAIELPIMTNNIKSAWNGASNQESS